MMEYSRRANRSDIHLSPDEEAKIEDTTRHYFDGMAPQRHTKPQRSEHSSRYVDSFTGNVPIPEYDQLQRLQNDPHFQNIVCISKETIDEFVETEYYNDLNHIDKQHHTTGTGFIRMENANRRGFTLKPDPSPDHHIASTGNPATNDWIPAVPSTEAFNSDKPKRSG